MKESIHIQNLGPIKNIYIEDIKPITVLIGESASGKSTLMKAIALFRWLYKMHNIRSYLKKSQISKSPFRFRMDTYFNNCGFDEYINKDTKIIYTTSFDNKKYTLEYVNGKLAGTADNNLIEEADLHFTKLSFISENRNTIPLWADKGASLSGDFLGFYFHEVYRDFDIASDSLREKDIDIPYLDIKFAIKKTHQGKKYTIKPTDDSYHEIQFKNSSSGTQNSIPLTLIAEHFSKHFSFEDAFNRSVLRYLSDSDRLTDFRPVKNLSDITKKLFIHIEEPELSLYPDAQCELIADVIEKCFISNKNKIELIFSTHSPYIVNYLNLLLKASDSNKTINGAKIKYEDLVVYQVSEGEITNLMLKNERLVNTNPLSDTINNIYDQYSEMK